jgi:hypothetical protein
VPAKLARDLRRSFAATGPGQIQRSPSANRGRGGRGQRWPYSKWRRARPPRPAGWRSRRATPGPSASARVGVPGSPTGAAHPPVA